MAQAFTNILLIQLGDIGDVVVTTPTIRAVKENYPDARVSIMVRKPFGSLLASDPHLHEVVESSKPHGSTFLMTKEYAVFVLRLRRAKYDLVIDLRTGDRGAILASMTGAKERIGRPSGTNQFWHNFMFTRIARHPVFNPTAHPGADQSLRVVREIGIDTSDSTPKLYVAPADQARAKKLLTEFGVAPLVGMVTINPYSRWKYKEWGNEKWGEVIGKLWGAYRIPAVLIGSPEEASDCQKIVAGRKDHAINLAGKTTLGELAAVISLSRLHMGVDSAAPHIAAALGIPTVTIHGPTDWRGWRIVNEQHKVVSPVMDCVPCNMMGCDGSGKSRCLDELDTEPVIRAAFEILQQHDHL